MKKLGKILVFAALGLFVLWLVFFCLRYIIFQKSVDLGKGFAEHFTAIGGVFGDLHYFDDKFTILWKAAGWLVAWFTIAFGFLMVVEGIFKRKPIMFVATVALVLGGFAVLDYIAFSGNYAYYIGRFNGNNTFYVLALVGFIILGFVVWAAAIAGGVLASKEKKEEPAPAPAPAQEPASAEAK